MFDVADLTRQCRKAAADEVVFASDDELLVAAVEYQAARSAMDAGEARVLGELQARGVTDRCFGLRTPKWVASQARVDHRPIGRRLRTGQWLRRLPEVDAALADGRLTADHATVLVEAAANPRIGDQIAATQSIWVDQAAETSFVDWRHQVRQTVALLDQDGGYDPDKDRDRNRLRFTTLDEGITRLAGDLVGVEALEVRQLVEAHADRMFRQLKNDANRSRDLPMPGRATLLALALAELVRRGAVVDRDATDGPVVDITLIVEATKLPPAGVAGPTGLTDVAGLAELTGRPGLGGPVEVTGGPVDTSGVDQLDPFDPYRRPEPIGNPLLDHGGPARTDNDHFLDPVTAECLLCDPAITTLIVDALGVPLNMGRQIRLANRQQRRALAKRDGGCIFPGCDAPVGWCDAHHVTWWDNGGPTDIFNLALLCRYHHGVTHRRGWTMTTTGDDEWFTWTTPTGDRLHSQRHRGRSPTAHPAHQHL